MPSQRRLANGGHEDPGPVRVVAATRSSQNTWSMLARECRLGHYILGGGAPLRASALAAGLRRRAAGLMHITITKKSSIRAHFNEAFCFTLFNI